MDTKKRQAVIFIATVGILVVFGVAMKAYITPQTQPSPSVQPREAFSPAEEKVVLAFAKSDLFGVPIHHFLK